jgi:hypothetical protein
MLLQDHKSSFVLPFTVPHNAIEVLQRLRDSYKGLSARKSLTEADQAVLVAMRVALKQSKKEHQVAE